MIALLPLLHACGGEPDQDYFYSVNVVNNTGSAITVRYDWDEVFWDSRWFGEETIQPGDHRIIEWNSWIPGSENIEVEYQGQKKLFRAPQFGSVTVETLDFLN